MQPKKRQSQPAHWRVAANRRGPVRIVPGATPDSEWPLQRDGWRPTERVNMRRDGHRIIDRRTVTAWDGEQKNFVRLKPQS